jgi:hypothetical protein
MNTINIVAEGLNNLGQMAQLASGNQYADLAKKYTDQLSALSQRLEAGSSVFKDYTRQMMQQQQQQMQ